MKSWYQNSYQSLSSSIGNAVTNSAAAVKAVVHKPDGVIPATVQHQQYVRLPIESARKLRWFETGAVNDLVRQHAEEKQSLMDCVRAMRGCMLQSGIEEQDLDANMRTRLDQAHLIAKADEAVYTALLVSAQDEICRLTNALHVAANAREGDHDPAQAPALCTASRSINSSASSLRTTSQPVRVTLSCVSEDSGLEGVKVSLQTDAAGGGAHSAHSAHALAGASWEPVDAALAWGDALYAACDSCKKASAAQREYSEVSSQPGSPQRCSSGAPASLNGDAATAEVLSVAQKWPDIAAGLRGLRGTPASTFSASPATSPRSSFRSESTVTLQAQLDMTRQLAASHSRRATDAEARSLESEHKLEEALADLQAAKANVQYLQERCRQLEKRNQDLERDTRHAASRSSQAPTNQAAATHQAERVRSAEDSLRSAQRNAASLQRALAAAEAREAALQMQLNALEAEVDQKEQLTARLHMLEARTDDAAAERSRAENYREVISQLEEKVQALTREITDSAREIAAAEARAVSGEAAASTALEAKRAAEQHAASLESRVAEEVELKLKNIGTDRAAWPPAAQEVVAELESSAADTSKQTRLKDEELQKTTEQLEVSQRQQAVMQDYVATAERELTAVRAEARVMTQSLEQQLKQVEAELASCQGQIRRLEASSHQAMHRPSAMPAMLRGRSQCMPSGNGDAVAPVGGNGNMDAAYLKNVVFKLLHAISAGKASERDALLPVVSMLLGASPQESTSIREAFVQASMFDLWAAKAQN